MTQPVSTDLNRIRWSRRGLFSIALLALTFAADGAMAEVKLPNIFTDSMVLQQKQENRIWGKDNPGQVVTISVGEKKLTATTDAAGNWEAKLPAMEVGAPLTITVVGSSTKTISDVLVGEVWVCSGQSNMQWSVAQSNDPDLERLAANYPNIRMINFPQTGSQEPIWSHDDRKWKVCTPENVPQFSAVGYFFARQIHQTTGVPIGMNLRTEINLFNLFIICSDAEISFLSNLADSAFELLPSPPSCWQ